MTEHDDDLTTQLTRTLTDHSDVMSGSSLGLADVKGRARSIRRRRTATAVVGAAAAVAVIIPTVALASHTGGSKNEPAPITQTPSPTATATDDGHQPAPGVLDVSDLPTGDAPRMEYVTDGKVLHQADGTTVDIGTQHPVNGLVTLTDGSRVFLTSTGGRFYAEVETPDGTFLDPVRTDGGLAANHAHTVAAWVDPTGQVMLWENGAAQPETNGDPIPVHGDLRVAAVLGDECSYSCTVFVNVPAGGAQIWQPWEVSKFYTREYRDGGLVTVRDVAGSLTIGQTSITDFDSCSTLFGGGEFRGFDTCKATLMSFSPDGSTLLGYPPYYDGLGPTSISMRDLEGRKLFERRADVKHQATVGDAQWEDETHLLTSVYQDGEWSLVRIASDGSMEYAVPPVPAEDVDNPFVVPTGGAPATS